MLPDPDATDLEEEVWRPWVEDAIDLDVMLLDQDATDPDATDPEEEVWWKPWEEWSTWAENATDQDVTDPDVTDLDLENINLTILYYFILN